MCLVKQKLQFNISSSDHPHTLWAVDRAGRVTSSTKAEAREVSPTGNWAEGSDWQLLIVGKQTFVCVLT